MEIIRMKIHADQPNEQKKFDWLTEQFNTKLDLLEAVATELDPESQIAESSPFN